MPEGLAGKHFFRLLENLKISLTTVPTASLTNIKMCIRDRNISPASGGGAPPLLSPTADPPALPGTGDLYTPAWFVQLSPTVPEIALRRHYFLQPPVLPEIKS